ncbi:MAG: TonB-dependent receptor [Azoarcus sp.]|jgi:vitamin B12 transporter|nr:TonB-dependent receptor [Azoarcus sp.]
MSVCKKTLACLCLAAIAVPIPSFAQDTAPELAAIVVTATRQETRASDLLADVSVIDREEIERSGQDTIIDLLARQPGIQTSASGGPGAAASIYIRGANSQQTRVLIDGLPANSVSLSGFPLHFMTLAEVERIEILRGPASSIHGADAIGGVIHIITRRGQPGLRADGFIGYGSHDTQQANAGISGGDGRWRFRVGANHYQTDGFSVRRHARNKDTDDDAYRNTGGAVSLSFLPAAGHEIGASYRQNEGLSHYDDSMSAASDYDFRARFRSTAWQLSSRNRFLENWESALRYGEVEDRQKNYDGLDTWSFGMPVDSVSKFHTRNRYLGWQNDLTLPLGKALAAVEYLKQEVGPDRGYTGAASYTDSPDSHNVSALLGWSAHLDRHRWQINARRDRHSDFGGKTTYGLAYGYRFGDGWQVHVNHGTAFKAPSAYQLFMDMGWGFHGNPDLKPEESRNSEAGLSWERGVHLASITYYRNKIENLIDWETNTYQNVNKALLEGVTLAYQGRIGAWKLGAAYDWLDARNENTGKRLGRRARDTASFDLARAWGKLDIGAEIIAVGQRYDDNSENESLGGYVLANLTASYALTPELRIEGRLNNLFDKKYETVRYYNTDDGFNVFIGLRYSPK